MIALPKQPDFPPGYQYVERSHERPALVSKQLGQGWIVIALGLTREEAIECAWSDYVEHEPEWAWYLAELRKVPK